MPFSPWNAPLSGCCQAGSPSAIQASAQGSPCLTTPPKAAGCLPSAAGHSGCQPPGTHLQASLSPGPAGPRLCVPSSRPSPLRSLPSLSTCPCAWHTAGAWQGLRGRCRSGWASLSHPPSAGSRQQGRSRRLSVISSPSPRRSLLGLCVTHPSGSAAPAPVERTGARAALFPLTLGSSLLLAQAGL